MADLNKPERRKEDGMEQEVKEHKIEVQEGNTGFLTVKLLNDILLQLKEIAYYTSHLEKKDKK